jgi:hypothetical protein
LRDSDKVQFKDDKMNKKDEEKSEISDEDRMPDLSDKDDNRSPLLLLG